MSAEEFLTAAGRSDRNAGPRLLVDWLADGRLGDADLRHVLARVWSSAEFPGSTLPVSTWVGLFRRAAYPVPDGPLRLYRGSTLGRYARGMAWTSDPDKARWFATRWALMTGRRAAAWTVVAPPSAVLAVMDEIEPDGRDEHEVIVDPRGLPRVRHLEMAGQ